ncbi:hypothetical protein TNIN_278821 [Trichonephila inaurata madagascariensis]|uniref:Uncharacterized protein n=1 Tax=Trichonephila inaurata madagascariensis TaxID=2747483 RepID=A0A8X6Y4M8_9ARAC|nr:hypothetical protein TNIN_278821 [Trichonephila inaurata madagascariensis]
MESLVCLLENKFAAYLFLPTCAFCYVCFTVIYVLFSLSSSDRKSHGTVSERKPSEKIECVTSASCPSITREIPAKIANTCVTRNAR